MEKFALDVMDVAVLPALCLTPANPAIATEVWSVLRCLPYPSRFLLYGKWRDRIEKTDLLRGASKLSP